MTQRQPGDAPFERGLFQGLVLARLESIDDSVKENNAGLKEVENTVAGLVTEVTVIKAMVPRKKLVNLSAIGLALTLAGGLAWGVYNLGVRILGG